MSDLQDLLRHEPVELVPTSDLTPHPRNPRRGNVDRIKEAFQAHGFYGTLIAQTSTGHVIVGNHRFKAAVELDMEQVPVQYLDVDDEQAYRILLSDNRSSDDSDYDMEALTSVLSEIYEDSGTLAGTGYDAESFSKLLKGLDEDPDGKYTQKVESPIYEPEGEAPSVFLLMDRDKTEELQQEIANAELNDDVREFLHAAAERHTVFRYDLIAEFYAHASAEVQALMEASALVIIDFDSAIEGGFVRLNEEILAQFGIEYPDA